MAKLNSLLDIVTKNSEEDIEDLLQLMKPSETPLEEIQEIFEENLGYDPTTYFDKKEISERLSSIAEDSDTPECVASEIEESHDTIVEDAYERFDMNKASYLEDALVESISEHTGWDPTHSDEEEDEFEDDNDFEEE